MHKCYYYQVPNETILSTMHAQTILLLCLQEICNKLLSQGVCRAEVRVNAAQGKAKSMTAATKEDCVLRQQPPRWADSQEEKMAEGLSRE